MASDASDRHIILLTGAPRREELFWTEDHLTADFTAQYYGKGIAELTDSTATSSRVRWRTVTTIQSHVQALSKDETVFLSSGAIAADTDVSQDFLNHSFSQLEAAQLPDVPAEITELDSSIETTFESFYSVPSQKNGRNDTQKDLPRQLAMTDLKQIPTASHLSKIAPQTMTINILVGIIAVQQQRTVSLRRTGLQMSLVEIVVGDDTRAGFSITVWLEPQSKTSSSTTLRTAVSSLRPGDVVLVSTLALSAFRGCVYGQSLSRRNASTKIWHLSHATKHNLQHKIDKVTDWRDRFVGRREPQRHPQAEKFPPETQ